ncbi:MAG TPA: carboxypeptidase regulatory-like domain-containing protein [Bryobacteraceae bacterium]|nr:carboxypeptidase regulatory-like domain-containing protein [Bryobacteraceae bacterium]
MWKLKFLNSLARWSCLALLCLLIPAAFGQSDNGTISGFAKDPSGANVPKATVTLKNETTGIQQQATTNDDGYFVFNSVPPGLYSVSVTAAGFKKFDSVHNKLDANSQLALDAVLTVGAATETVEVVASAQALQTESSTVEKLVSRAQIDGLELNGRNPLYMASLQPGMRSGSTLGDFNFGLTNGGYSVNGARSQETTITFDGAPAVRTRANGTSIAVADVDSTQEIQVLTSNYSPEYGRSAGGQIRIVTQGGGSQFHGNAFEYFRNSELNANTWSRNQSTFTNFASPFRYNQFGFNIGGPIFIPGKFNTGRDKWFFYWGEEWARYRNVQTQTQEVPTLLMHQGNFSELLGSNIFYSTPKTIVDPSTGIPFPNNVIPTSKLSVNGIGIMNLYPLPNGLVNGNQNWIAQASQPINQRKETINSDILPSSKDRIQFRRTNFAYYEKDPFDQGTNITPKEFNRPNQVNSLAWTHTFGPTLLNEARFTLSVDDVYIPVVTSAPGFNRQTFGINYPYIFPNGKDIPTKVPSITVSNFYSFTAGPYPSHSSGPIYTLNDTLTKVWGKHQFKFGFQWERSGENDGDQINVSSVPGGANNQNGQFGFSDGSYSGIGMANLALGLANSYTEIGQRAETDYRGYLYEWFAQDSWKVTSKLHIDYGVRQTINVPYKALWGNQIFFDPALYSPSAAVTVDPKTGLVQVGSGNQYNGMVIPGSGWPSNALGHGITQAGNPAYDALFHNYPDYYANIYAPVQPRVGIAYEVNDKTVVRSGAGAFVNRMGLWDNIFPGANSPFQPFTTVNNVSVDNPGAGLTTTTAAPITVTTIGRNLKSSESWQWNATVQRQMMWKSFLEVAYIGRRGLYLPQVWDINQPTVGAQQANPGIAVNALRPYKGFASIQMEQSTATSMYNALQLAWNRRFNSGLAFSFSYTLAKSSDSGSNYRDILPDTYNASNLWGPSEFDVHHMVVITYVYTLPIFKNGSGVSHKLLGGWQISGVNQFQTGTPCGIGTNNDFAGVGEYGSFGCGNQGEFWNMAQKPSILGQFATTTATPNYYFQTTTASGAPIFTQPAAGTFVLQKGVRGSIYQPGFQDWNLGLFKSFQINERTGFQFRAEAFDVNNHPNWSGPGLNPTSSSFGKVTSKTGLARNLQLSLRFYF